MDVVTAQWPNEEMASLSCFFVSLLIFSFYILWFPLLLFKVSFFFLPLFLKSTSYMTSYCQYYGSLVFHLRLSSKWRVAGTKPLSAMDVKRPILWDITPCRKQTSAFCLLRSAYFSALKTEVIYPPEHLLFHWNISEKTELFKKVGYLLISCICRLTELLLRLIHMDWTRISSDHA